jgi:acyl-CoA synthetase (AMP-forming)/AMP-acid ligase II
MLRNIEDYLDCLEHYRDQIAFLEGETSVSYQEFLDLVQSFRSGILDEINAGDIVYLSAEFSGTGSAMLLALLSAGAVVVPISYYGGINSAAYESVVAPNWRINLDRQNVNVEKCSLPINCTKHSLIEDLRAVHTPGLVLFSSGSSGRPKAMVYSFDRVITRFQRAKKSSISIPFLMFDHFGGLNTLLGILRSGSTAVVVGDRSPQSVARAIEKYKVNVLPATPSFLNQMVVSGVFSQFDLSSLGLVTYGTESMSEALLRRLCSLLPSTKFLQTYGLSETGVLSTKSKSRDSTWVELIDDDYDAKVCDGTLWIRSKFGMVGYLNAEAEIDAEGFFNTGDRVEIDGNYIRFLGRNSDMINVAGLKVFPSEVEAVIQELPEVLDCVVVGEPNALLGTIVCARVQVSESNGASVHLKTNIRKKCAQVLEKHKVPQRIDLTRDTLVSGRLKKKRRF